MTPASRFPETASGRIILLMLTAGIALAAIDHRAHLFGALPYLLILACPLLHLALHRGQGRHGNRKDHGHV
ncbi:DUF2933 domain-containing protein [Chthonobacter rhizosphaerae]|uniref:DUF2933 domain-containing protein n=1 Tax=Chthonobacter rhizosphaerae TaxID=2735553 RepID=UPI0015EF0961|nr:DUF2933 domain-containing protein [Chthonobacter rhizosphaerae]